MKFVYGEPVLVVGKNLVVADVHVGIEFELQKKGVLLPLQYKEAAQKINNLLGQTSCNALYILGDAKHDYFGSKDREVRTMASFFKAVKAKTTVIKGNHDAELEKISGVTVIGPKGFLLKHNGVSHLLAHGQANPDEQAFEKADWVILGHYHPMIEVKEADGFVWRDRAWIIGEFRRPRKRFVVMPAFNDLAGGIAFNAPQPKGPFFKRFGLNKKSTQAVLLSGTRIGMLESLAKKNCLR